MREIVHQGLASLVTQQGTVQIKSSQVKEIVYASVEPDILNKQEIEANILTRPMVLYNWWVDHTFWAKNLAIAYTKEAEKAYLNEQSNWTQSLGWAFHFFTDRATPYHSPNKLVPMIHSITDNYEVGVKSLEGFSTRSQIAGGVVNAGLNLLSKAIGLKLDHDDFETQCEKKWGTQKSLTSEIFLSLTKPDRDKLNLGLIEKKLNDLYKKYKTISVEWINSDKNYANYMADIAFVLDLACCFVIKK